jgi:hypothetical protein
MKKILVLLSLGLSVSVSQAELVQQFKNPTFSGQGWASHVLTVEQMRQSAESQKAAKAASEKAAAENALTNTPLAKFMSLFTGQVYSQLATQLTNNLFKECAAGATCNSGSFMVSETQQIQWIKNSANGVVTLTVFDGKKVNDAFVPNEKFTQQIVVPISSFSF